jgi:type II secretory pathway pseudopilin PulG
MRQAARKPKRKAAFTIVELLTVMSIIVILIGLLVPALTRIKIFAQTVRQKAQFHSMDAAIELFNNEFEGYPPSNALDENNQPYCGAMRLCEAMMGQDLLGFHINSVFRADLTDRLSNPLYVPGTIKARKGPFLPLESANAFRLRDIYGAGGANPFNEDLYVLCDVYKRQMGSGKKTGMPILYYRADTANSLHDPNSLPTPVDNMDNIYNYWDNQVLLGLGMPWKAGGADQHPLSDPEIFYRNTRSHQIEQPARPYKAESYILISAGYDGEYGTADDVFNFDWKSR